MSVVLWQAILYVVAVALLVLTAVGVAARISLVALAGALALLAFALPAVVAGLR